MTFFTPDLQQGGFFAILRVNALSFNEESRFPARRYDFVRVCLHL